MILKTLSRACFLVCGWEPTHRLSTGRVTTQQNPLYGYQAHAHRSSEHTLLSPAAGNMKASRCAKTSLRSHSTERAAAY